MEYSYLQSENNVSVLRSRAITQIISTIWMTKENKCILLGWLYKNDGVQVTYIYYWGFVTFIPL